jgi:hypothetical protein
MNTLPPTVAGGMVIYEAPCASQVPDPSSLGFFYSNGFGFADLDTAFATETLFGVYRFGFFILELEYLDRTNFDTFSTTCAFVLIH